MACCFAFIELVLGPKAKIPKTLVDRFEFEEILGEGGSATVHRCRSRRSGALRAIKAIWKVQPDFDLVDLTAEIELLGSMKHPNILLLHSHIQTKRQSFLELELCEGKDLFKRFGAGPVVEEDAAMIAAQLFKAVAFLHEHSVAHRDVKAENCLFVSKGPLRGNQLKLCDFGLATRFNAAERWPLKQLVGTALYLAPEVLEERYGPKCDVWSSGVTLFRALSCSQPYPGGPKDVIAALKRGAPWTFRSSRWNSVSGDAKRVVTWLMQFDSECRPTAQDVLSDAWVSASMSR